MTIPKFRVFENHRLSRPFYIYDISSDLGRTYIDGFGRIYPETTKIMQYTGLKDINENEICEDDIVAYFDPDHLQEFPPYKSPISFDEGCFVFKSHEFNMELDNLSCNGIKKWDIQIIGNIHQNPKLLEE